MTDQTAAGLFADDIMRIIMERLSVRLQPSGPMTNGVATAIEVLLVDNQTKTAVRCTGSPICIAQVVQGVQFDFGELPVAARTQR